MGHCFSFKSYQRTFAKPLRTARGEWSVREGFVLRVESESGVGYGEIAPIPEFGTETVAQARAFLARLEHAPDLAASADLAGLPCCAFGLSSALAGLGPTVARRDYEVAALLPAGRAALAVATSKVAAGYTTFKWKVGVESLESELAVLEALLEALPSAVRLRLDANCGLSVAALEDWLIALQRYGACIEYLEQPLPVGAEAEMARVAELSGVPIALDESLHGVGGLSWLAAGAWPGPLVVKPALAGDVNQLVEWLRPVAQQVVWSSVFETSVGVQAALQIADQLPETPRAIGFDTLDAFTDSLGSLTRAPVLSAAERAQLNPKTLWNQLPHLI